MSRSASGRGLRRRGALHVWEDRFGPNMTPMVDIVLVILIFFMAGTTFIGREWLLRSEAFAKGTAASPPDPMELPPVWLTISLSVGADGRTVYAGLGPDAGVTAPLGELGAKIGAFARGTDMKKIIVVFVPTKDVPYRDVVAAHEACAAAGIERVGVTP